MPISRGMFDSFLRPRIREVIGDEFALPDKGYRMYMNIASSEELEEKDREFAVLNAAPVKLEGEEVTEQDPLEGLQTLYTHVAYALRASITKEMRDDDLTGKMNNIASWIGKGMGITEAQQGAQVLNNGFLTNLADGVPLFDLLHPLLRGGTQSNTVTTGTQLTPNELQLAKTAIRQQVDQAGNPIKANGVMVVVPNGQEFRLREVVGPPTVRMKPLEQSNTQDVVASTVTGMVDDWLTDQDAWFVLTPKAFHKLKFYWRTSPIRWDWFDNPTLSHIFAMFMRLSQGASTHIGTWGNAGP